ncbi:hypothetical protein IE81DRAFT_367341 [Ceraceosorus guamensis]|uniref:Uncharacterized protein n=1 Tax=Ceraceosorus guamensis TaxID=1522189 RepID=A0A316VW23_9BASI|nr:hypothetical protein IE81DRAFT_367341 [Ceraceosorus guamensis]PWN41642.1 hypothetical protein IE81DRAFT_367341 [Ceraceosorus guamensis]
MVEPIHNPTPKFRDIAKAVEGLTPSPEQQEILKLCKNIHKSAFKGEIQIAQRAIDNITTVEKLLKMVGGEYQKGFPAGNHFERTDYVQTLLERLLPIIETITSNASKKNHDELVALRKENQNLKAEKEAFLQRLLKDPFLIGEGSDSKSS